MLIVTHGLSGGLIATKIKNPIIISPLTFLLHLFLDRLPHWDFGTDFRKRKKITNILLALIDLLGGVFLCWFIFQKNIPFNHLLWLGFLFSILPDILEAPSVFFNLHFPILDKLEVVHSEVFHRKRRLPHGIIAQVIIWAGVILLNKLIP